MKKITQTHLTEVNGKLVKYLIGDCLSVNCSNGYFLGVLISNKFNKYYDLTLIEFYEKRKPTIHDFASSNFFGTRLDSNEGIIYVVDVKMITCKIVDTLELFEKVGYLNIDRKGDNVNYSYIDNISQLEKYYLEEIQIRIQKSLNAKLNPDLGFAGRHLIEINNLLTTKNRTNKVNKTNNNSFKNKIVNAIRNLIFTK